MIKSLFFDIDGTLCSLKTHEIPLSTIEALEAAKARGVKIFISTGRPIQIINNIGAIEHLVDGYITTNGAYCFVGDEEVCSTPIPTVTYFLQRGHTYSNKAMHPNSLFKPPH